ncbi:DUF3801 domain-containing protein [Ruminococcus sp.]|uniref:DUF3801 domain-containing protein n=1 Tax=Ruminococcus sp. TaxID=41978 RepID=UPI00258F1378|nr:DUF3801 domain-containing protein [Ruminococcus sp.]MCR5019980.1 DUF3801 domain-containing protein [Ruminococcus sp.]
MHGDDVASAGVTVTTDLISKANEIILEIIKINIDKERQKEPKVKKAKEYRGDVSLKKLKSGGEIGMLPSYSKEDFKELAKRAKKLGIPVAGIQEKGKENTLSVFFNLKDKLTLDNIVKDIHAMKAQGSPEQAEKMITFDKANVEGFQMYCADHDIPVNFMESQDGVKCIFNAAYEKQIDRALVNYRKMQAELSKISVEIVKENGKPKIVLTDMNDGKKLTMNFCTKARLERMLNERMGFEPFKAAEVANVLAGRLTDEQKKFYYSGSRTVEQMDYFEKDIKLDDDNILTEKFSFARMKFKNEKAPHLTITDSEGNFVVLSGANIRREDVERNIRDYLKVNDNETIAAILAKAEKLGFAEKAIAINFKEYTIERESQNSFTVTGGSTVLRLDLTDKESAIKQMTDTFGMSRKKAEKIFGKAQKQSVSMNTLQRAKAKIAKPTNPLTNKTRNRGARK